MEPFLVPDDLYGDRFPRLVIPALDHLTERALAEDTDDLVPVRQVIVRYDQVVSPLIIVAKVVLRNVCPGSVLVTLDASIVDFGKVENLLTLIV